MPAIMEGYADDCELVSPGYRIVRGKAGVEASFQHLFKIFGNMAVQIEDVLIEHEALDRVAYMSTVTATHLGEVLGFPGTGRRLSFKGVIMLSFKDGRIATERRLYDLTEVLLQIDGVSRIH